MTYTEPTDQSIASALARYAEEAVPTEVGLWPRVEAALVVRRRSPWPRVATSLTLAVLALSLVAATPVRTFAGERLQRFPYGGVQRFGTMLIDPLQFLRGETPPAPANARRPTVSGISKPMTPSLTLAEAQGQADFPIRTPAWLPPGVVFGGAIVFPGGGVGMSYRAADDPSRGLSIQEFRGSRAGGYMIPASAARAAQVHGQPAVYAHGSWDQSRHWHGEADVGLLSWEENGFTYVLQFSGLGLSKEDMLRIAESLH